MKTNYLKRGITGALLMVLTMAFGLIYFTNQPTSVKASISMNPAYDLSEWQHQFTDDQVQQLKSEASFVILRAQYGSTYHDKTFANNLSLIQKYKIPYGVYSYSLYDSPSDAKQEAKSLYNLAPDAGFYVNDIEENNVTSGTLDSATSAWANQMRTLTDKPVILYSGLNFMNNNIGSSKNSYDAIWLAAYSAYEPNPSYHYDLWQFTSSKYSAALGQKVDASVIPTGGKPLSFWTGSTSISANNSTTPNTNILNPTNSSSSSSSDSSNSSDSTSSSSSSNSSSSSSSSSSVDSSSSSSVSTSSSSANQQSDSTSSSSEVSRIDKPKKAKKQAKKPAVTVVKPKINHAVYYSSTQIKKLRVMNKSGIYLYNKKGKVIRHYKRGQVIKIKGFRQLGTITQSQTANGDHFTANKKLVKWVK